MYFELTYLITPRQETTPFGGSCEPPMAQLSGLHGQEEGKGELHEQQDTGEKQLTKYVDL